jgi:hypothetical protein
MYIISNPARVKNTKPMPTGKIILVEKIQVFTNEKML